eukprot:1096200-Rhodomonas_salina.2
MRLRVYDQELIWSRGCATACVPTDTRVCSGEIQATDCAAQEVRATPTPKSGTDRERGSQPRGSPLRAGPSGTLADL